MSDESLTRTLNKIAKWRTFFTSWQLGTRPDTDGETKAVKHHHERSIILRVEMTALTTLLLEKGIFTREEMSDATEAAAVELDHAFETTFPGFASDHNGLRILMPEARETMKKLNFPK